MYPYLKRDVSFAMKKNGSNVKHGAAMHSWPTMHIKLLVALGGYAVVPKRTNCANLSCHKGICKMHFSFLLVVRLQFSNCCILFHRVAAIAGLVYRIPADCGSYERNLCDILL